MATNACLNFRTLSPLELVPILKSGVSELSPGYDNLLSELSNLDSKIHVYSRPKTQQYEELSRDVVDMRLCSWSCDSSCGAVDIHIYQSSVFIVEVTLSVPMGSAHEIEAKVQIQTRKAIAEVYPQFTAMLQKLAAESQSPLLDVERFRRIPTNASISWSARMLLVRTNQLDVPEIQNLLHEWLKDTGCPEDAQSIISGRKDYSMTWLNYVIVDIEAEDYRLDAMILAQYYYAAQDVLNRDLKRAISAAYREKHLKVVEQLLSRTRVNARLHQIQYHEHLKLLTRVKRRLLNDVLQGWEFSSLVDNSERMVEICSSRLEEADHRRRERSTVLTDLLLVTLSFFAVFELCLYLVEFSREMMARPALDYTDESSSFFLSSIAAIDSDIMFGIGIGLTMLLVVAYKFIKDN